MENAKPIIIKEEINHRLLEKINDENLKYLYNLFSTLHRNDKFLERVSVSLINRLYQDGYLNISKIRLDRQIEVEEEKQRRQNDSEMPKML